MATKHVLRLAGWIVGWAVVITGFATLGRAWAVLGGTLAFVATLWLVIWLPRTAHTAFERGSYARSARRYRAIGALAFTAARERMAVLSRAGCLVSIGRLADAETLHTAIASTTLAHAERAVWLNNRACAMLEAGHEPGAALALAEEAAVLRPDVPAIQHTRGLALVAIGRHDDAISVLDAMRVGGELPTRLEADRCRELARAWDAKGQTEYADDYRARAHLMSR